MEGNKFAAGEVKASKWEVLGRRVMVQVMRQLVSLWQRAWMLGKDDPRRFIHALKVGVALTSVSFLYLLEPLFQGVGQNAMWAVMTVVVVLEFTAGATLCKGLNRGFGTICAGALAFLIEFVADKSGTVLRASFIGTSVFIVGFLATYLRFFPYIKKNYDYGVVIFLLTFNLITVSSFRVHNVLHLARDRLYTIAIGCGVCLIMSLLVLPNWSGEELHNSTICKLEVLAKSIEDCVNDYFKDQNKEENLSRDQICKGYKTVLDSKSNDEALALFASWEPRHTRHCYRYPWEQCVKLGAVLRHFACTVAALDGCLESEIQTPTSIRSLFREPCRRVAAEVSKVLAELARSIRNHAHCSQNVLSDHLHEALQDLNSAIKSQPRLFLGSKNTKDAAKMLAHGRSNNNNNNNNINSSAVTLASFKTDTSSLLEWQTKRRADQSRESTDRKTLRPTLSKIAITSLEFSEALPFAAFASLLVEMVARLDLVIEEVEELARAANFKEFPREADTTINIEPLDKKGCRATNYQSHVVSQSAE